MEVFGLLLAQELLILLRIQVMVLLGLESENLFFHLVLIMLHGMESDGLLLV